MQKHILLPAGTLLCGGCGLLLRRWELASVFDKEGLPIQGAPATLALAALSAAFLALTALLAWRMCRGAPELSFDEAYHCPAPAYAAVTVLCAALLVAAGIFTAKENLPRLSTSPFILLLAVMWVLSGVCVFLTGQKNYRETGNGRFAAPLLVPAYTGCLWLILTYQSRAGDPILQDYVYLILAVIFNLLGLYFMAGFSFEKGKAALALWSGFAAVYFSAVALAGQAGMAPLFIHLFTIIYFTTHGAVLLRALGTKREEPLHE